MKMFPNRRAQYPNRASNCVADESAPKAPTAEPIRPKKREPIFTMCGLLGPTVVAFLSVYARLTGGFMLILIAGLLCPFMAFYRDEAWAPLSLLGIPILVVIVLLLVTCVDLGPIY